MGENENKNYFLDKQTFFEHQLCPAVWKFLFLVLEFKM